MRDQYSISSRPHRRGLLRGCMQRKDAILMREFDLGLGEALYVATYEHNYPSEKFRDDDFQVADAEEACDYIIGRGVFSTLERPISAACAYEDEDGFSVAFKDATLSGA